MTPDPPFLPPTAEELAEWERSAAAENDHYYQVPARDEAEREAYDHIEQVEAEIAEAEEHNHHFLGAHPSDYPPHDYQCEDGCPYETDAERQARIELDEWIEEQRELDAAAEWEEAADEFDGRYLEWTGHHGCQVVTAEFEAETDEPELEAEP